MLPGKDSSHKNSVCKSPFLSMREETRRVQGAGPRTLWALSGEVAVQTASLSNSVCVSASVSISRRRKGA